ncbi:MAG TPA: PEGA domain-containing protein, partial [Polyangiaceae bacterium]|nr:PEGA domain-containing protein [Polyangiaceae bacterium]
MRMCRLVCAILTIAALWAGALFTGNAALAQPPPNTPAPAITVEPAAPQPSAAPAAPAAPEVPDAKSVASGHFRKGKELFAKNAWAAALSEFLESRKLFPTWSATSNAAICLKNLQRYDEALGMLEALLNDFKDALPAGVKEAAQKEVIELRKSAGSIVIDDAEIGAALSIDGRSRGEYPAPPLYVLTGSHVVRVYKEGFEAFEKTADVAPGQTVKVSARLQRLVRSGRLEITERSGKKLDVIVDGFHVGETPWEGPIAVGDHTVMLRGTEGLGTRPTPISIRLNQRITLDLAAADLGASLRINPMPADASVAIDGIFVGRGAWDGRMNPGDHPIKVVADGYFPETRRVEL